MQITFLFCLPFEQSNTLGEGAVLKVHYGWDCDKCTLTYVGDVLGVSPERVRKIEYKAMRKIMARRSSKRVVDKISFAEQYFKNIDKSSLLFGECTNECSN